MVAVGFIPLPVTDGNADQSVATITLDIADIAVETAMPNQ